MRKFDFVIMNPPYAGSGNPLFMEIAKVFYENCLSDEGKLVSINPTSVIDKYLWWFGFAFQKSTKKLYGGGWNEGQGLVL